MYDRFPAVNRERERETDRQTDRQTDRETETERDRDRQTDRELSTGLCSWNEESNQDAGRRLVGLIVRQVYKDTRICIRQRQFSASEANSKHWFNYDNLPPLEEGVGQRCSECAS